MHGAIRLRLFGSVHPAGAPPFPISRYSQIVVEFWAPWCGKCKQIAPFVADLARRHPGVTIASFDTTEAKLEAFSTELGVKASVGSACVFKLTAAYRCSSMEPSLL